MLKGRDLLSIHDLSSEEVEAILALAEELKAMQTAGIEHRSRIRLASSRAISTA